MIRLTGIRKNGVIPERRHDAFLLALLLAVGMNVAFFAAQALLPHLSALLQALGVKPDAVREEALPFVLVDPSFLDEESAPDDASATAAVNRAARQEEAAPAAGEEVYRPEGVDEILLTEEGNPGEIDPGADSAGAPDVEAIGAEAEVEGEEAEEAVDAAEAAEESPPAGEPAVEELPPEAEPAPEALPPAPPVPPAPPPEPVEAPEAVEEIPPEAVELPEVEPEAVEEVSEVEPVADAVPEPVAEVIDLAMLPLSDAGIFDPQTREIRERAQPVPPAPVAAPPAVPPVAAPVPEQFEAREFAERPGGPVRPVPRQRANARRPTFRQMGGASAAGGAPPRRSVAGEEADLFGDPYMALLRDKYPEYMNKLGRMLQDSLNRTMVLYPNYYAAGQAYLQFRIDAGGGIGWHRVLRPAEGAGENTLRAISERTLLEAGPFDPPPAAMLADPAFQRMSLTVNIY